MVVRDDIHKELDTMDDEEAIAVLEGRLPAQDSPAEQNAARMIADGLLAERDLQGGGFQDTETSQPWMKMAAALMMGVLVTSVFTVPTQVAERSSGTATANVVFLDTFRGSDDSMLPVVNIGEADSVVSLIAYPDFTDAQSLMVQIEQAPSDFVIGSQTSDDTSWETIFSERTDIGTQDSVVVNVSSDLLEPGIYRLSVLSQSDTGITGTTSALFRAVP